MDVKDTIVAEENHLEACLSIFCCKPQPEGISSQQTLSERGQRGGLIQKIRGHCGRKPWNLPYRCGYATVGPPNSVPLLTMRCENSTIHPWSDFRCPINRITRFHITKHCCSNRSSITHPKFSPVDSVISIEKETCTSLGIYGKNTNFATRNGIA